MQTEHVSSGCFPTALSPSHSHHLHQKRSLLLFIICPLLVAYFRNSTSTFTAVSSTVFLHQTQLNPHAGETRGGRAGDVRRWFRQTITKQVGGCCWGQKGGWGLGGATGGQAGKLDGVRVMVLEISCWAEAAVWKRGSVRQGLRCSGRSQWDTAQVRDLLMDNRCVRGESQSPTEGGVGNYVQSALNTTLHQRSAVSTAEVCKHWSLPSIPFEV